MTATLALGGCGTSFSAQTNQVYQPGVGANHRGEVDVLNTLLVANENDSATLSASLVNKTEDDQSLSSVTVTTMTDQELPVRSTKILLPLQSDVLSILGGAGDAGGFVVTSGAEAGMYVKVTFTFSDSAPVTIEAPVVARTAEYDKVADATPTEPAEVPDSAQQGAEGVDE